MMSSRRPPSCRFGRVTWYVSPRTVEDPCPVNVGITVALVPTLFSSAVDLLEVLLERGRGPGEDLGRELLEGPA